MPSSDDPDIYPLSYEEADNLLDYMHENYSYNIYTLFYFSIYNGLRRGGSLALRWRNVNIDNLNLHVTEAVDEITGEGLEYGDTKNDASKRTVDYDKDTGNILRNLQKKYLKNYKIAKLVFLHEDGTKISPDYITKLFRKDWDTPQLQLL